MEAQLETPGHLSRARQRLRLCPIQPRTLHVPARTVWPCALCMLTGSVPQTPSCVPRSHILTKPFRSQHSQPMPIPRSSPYQPHMLPAQVSEVPQGQVPCNHEGVPPGLGVLIFQHHPGVRDTQESPVRAEALRVCRVTPQRVPRRVAHRCTRHRHRVTASAPRRPPLATAARTRRPSASARAGLPRSGARGRCPGAPHQHRKGVLGAFLGSLCGGWGRPWHSDVRHRRHVSRRRDRDTRGQKATQQRLKRCAWPNRANANHASRAPRGEPMP